jgi:exonuclease VII large subunit
LDNFEKNINHNNPERQLSLGYSIATIGSKIIRNVDDAKVDGDMDIRMANGVINSQIKNINKINKK